MEASAAPFLKAWLGTGTPAAAHAPWPRVVVDQDQWSALLDGPALAGLTLLGLWGEPGLVHMALHDPADGTIGVISLSCPSGRYKAVGRVRPAAIRPERALSDLVGLVPEGLPDARPWLDHGRWPLRHPLGEAAPMPADAVRPAAADYPFLPVEGESLHQIPVGPVHAGIIEPGHFRFTASGETVVRLEERLGYVHKGIERLMAGAPLDRAARLAGRVSGDSTVAYAVAFARAAEAATGTEVPPRAHMLRGLMAELERLANHFGDIGAICNDAAFALMLAHCGVLREAVLQVAEACFGHRLMMDRVVPGGVAADLDDSGIKRIVRLLAECRPRFRKLAAIYDTTASLQDRTVNTGVVSPALVAAFGAGGFVGRASGRAFDARQSPGYPPYDEVAFTLPLLDSGDVNARVWIRIREVRQSFRLIRQFLKALAHGPVRAELGPPAGGSAEGMALVEGFRGDILVWLRLSPGGTVERCHLRDPSWFQWPLLEAAIEGNIVADFPLCNKSFNCSYSGHDL